MPPLMRWLAKLRHSPVFTRVERVGGEGRRWQFLPGAVEDERTFWRVYDPRTRDALELPWDAQDGARVRFAVYRIDAAGGERDATPGDIAMLEAHAREALFYAATRLREGEFTIETEAYGL